MSTPSKLLFLPGASGNIQFWQPAAALLRHPASHVHLGWPGFGATPDDPAVQGIDDLVERVVAEIDQPSALIAQSMGGVIALMAAIKRPELVTHLVLTVTSGGVDMRDLVVHDWRVDFVQNNPTVPRWFIDLQLDLSASLASIQAPALLLWGDSDPISPVAVGERLAALLAHAHLHVCPGGDHDLGSVFASDIAPLIDAYLAQ